jgi:hypothetical protein
MISSGKLILITASSSTSQGVLIRNVSETGLWPVIVEDEVIVAL